MFMTRFMADYRIEIFLFFNTILELHLVFELRNSINWGFEEILLEDFFFLISSKLLMTSCEYVPHSSH